MYFSIKFAFDLKRKVKLKLQYLDIFHGLAYQNIFPLDSKRQQSSKVNITETGTRRITPKFP